MLKRTPFFKAHEEAGAKLIDFGGFEMPVQYDSIKKEHLAVRNDVGLFDVSHMGEFYVTGADALELIQKVTVNDASKLKDGKAQYTVMCYEDGGIVDDLLVYRFAEDTYMLVVNAANRDKDFEWITNHNETDAKVENASDDMCLLAVQGPQSMDTLQKLTETNLDDIGFYNFTTGTLAGCEDMIISATGYTGEKGFELYFDKRNMDPIEIWDAIMEAGQDFKIEPAGLGARDTLRLEMGLALYGNDITSETNPLEARLGWLTKLDKGEFIGRQSLVEIKEQGLKRKLMGFVVNDSRSIPRKGYDICNTDGDVIGEVTSGSPSFILETGIAMGYIPVDTAEEGNQVQIKIRKKLVDAEVAIPPFINKK